MWQKYSIGHKWIETFYSCNFFLLSEGAKAAKNAFREDRDKHAGWWNATEFKEITGAIAIEVGEHCYIKALDDGSFTLGKMEFKFHHNYTQRH